MPNETQPTKSKYRIKLLAIFAVQLALFPFLSFKPGTTEIVFEAWQDWAGFAALLTTIFVGLRLECESCQTSVWRISFSERFKGLPQAPAGFSLLLRFGFSRKCEVCGTQRH